MSQPASNQNEPSKMKKLTSGIVEETIKSRLPQRNGAGETKRMPPAQTTSASLPASEPESMFSRFKLMPAFWTVASILSMTVNIILIAILLVALRMLGAIQLTANDQVSGLLGGLYTNFVAMDKATIIADVPVDSSVPLNIIVPVKTTTRITLAENTVIPNAHVRINSGPLIIDSNAEVTLPANTPLMVNLDFQLNVQDNIPVKLNVPVKIPMSQTELHAPFVGLRKVVEPFYCLVEPNALVDNVNICSPTVNFQMTPEPVNP